jgi:hypothetical protein
VVAILAVVCRELDGCGAHALRTESDGRTRRRTVAASFTIGENGPRTGGEETLEARRMDIARSILRIDGYRIYDESLFYRTQ